MQVSNSLGLCVLCVFCVCVAQWTAACRDGWTETEGSAERVWETHTDVQISARSSAGHHQTRTGHLHTSLNTYYWTHTKPSVLNFLNTLFLKSVASDICMACKTFRRLCFPCFYAFYWTVSHAQYSTCAQCYTQQDRLCTNSNWCTNWWV